MKKYIILLVSLIVTSVSADAQFIVSRIAGTGVSGFSGDGGPATDAQVRSTQGICRDAVGNIYIGDVGNKRVRKIDTFGNITTVAGNGTSGFSGDGAPATAASLNFYGVSCDPAGNLLIGDWNNHRVRRVDAVTGIITTVAGNGTSATTGDGGPATAAGIKRPIDAVYDAAHNIIISEYSGGRIRKVDGATGIITTIAGGGSGSADGVPATSVSLGSPVQIVIAMGNIYIAFQSGYVKRITPDGLIYRVAGGGTGMGSGIPATAASLSGPEGVAADCHGNIYIADNDHNRIKMVDPLGTLTIIGGGGTIVPTAAGVPALSANFHNQLLTFGRDGGLYITNDAASMMWKMWDVAETCPDDTTVIGGGGTGIPDTSGGGVGGGAGGGPDTTGGGSGGGFDSTDGGGAGGGGGDTVHTGGGVNTNIHVGDAHTLGVNGQFQNEELRIYPNPANDMLYIHGNGNARVIITSADGRIVLDKRNKREVSISHFAAGTYIVTVYDENGRKLKVEHILKE